MIATLVRATSTLSGRHGGLSCKALPTFPEFGFSATNQSESSDHLFCGAVSNGYVHRLTIDLTGEPHGISGRFVLTNRSPAFRDLRSGNIEPASSIEGNPLLYRCMSTVVFDRGAPLSNLHANVLSAPETHRQSLLSDLATDW